MGKIYSKITDLFKKATILATLLVFMPVSLSLSGFNSSASVNTPTALAPTVTKAVNSPQDDLPYKGLKSEKNRQKFKNLPNILQRIAKCESSKRHFKKNGELVTNENDNKTTDFGLFQINSIHIPDAEKLGIDIKTFDGNIEYAKILFKEQNVRPWLASFDCWRVK